MGAESSASAALPGLRRNVHDRRIDQLRGEPLYLVNELLDSEEPANSPAQLSNVEKASAPGAHMMHPKASDIGTTTSAISSPGHPDGTTGNPPLPTHVASRPPSSRRQDSHAATKKLALSLPPHGHYPRGHRLCGKPAGATGETLERGGDFLVRHRSLRQEAREALRRLAQQPENSILVRNYESILWVRQLLSFPGYLASRVRNVSALPHTSAHRIASTPSVSVSHRRCTRTTSIEPAAPELGTRRVLRLSMGAREEAGPQAAR